MFASPFDEALASNGPVAVFLPDREGKLRFDADWTRDAWEREPGVAGPHRWLLIRDRATRYVIVVLVTGDGLLATHPRADIRAYGSRDEAVAVRNGLGSVALAEAPW